MNELCFSHDRKKCVSENVVIFDLNLLFCLIEIDRQVQGDRERGKEKKRKKKIERQFSMSDLQRAKRIRTLGLLQFSGLCRETKKVEIGNR